MIAAFDLQKIAKENCRSLFLMCRQSHLMPIKLHRLTNQMPVCKNMFILLRVKAMLAESVLPQDLLVAAFSSPLPSPHQWVVR